MDLDNTYRTTKDPSHLNAFYQSHSMIFVSPALELIQILCIFFRLKLSIYKAKSFCDHQIFQNESFLETFLKNTGVFGHFSYSFSLKPKITEPMQHRPKNSKLLKKNEREIKSQHILIQNYKNTDYSYNFTSMHLILACDIFHITS